jgi:HK97 gp10 family phage protein
MPQFAMNFSADVEKLFTQLGNKIDEVAPKMLAETAPIVKEIAKAKAPYSGELHKHMVEGIEFTKPTKAKNGAWISNITIKGKRQDGERLMEIAAVNEYGTSKMSPQPFLKPAIKQAEPEVNRMMQEIFIREMLK